MKKTLKSLFKIIPFKQELFTILKKIWIPKKSIYKHLYFNGVFNVKINDSKAFKLMHYGYQIENEIFWNGLLNGFEKESLKIWVELCKNSNNILDIGANTGIYCLIAKTVNPKAQVYAFEPVKRVFIKLQENINLNNLNILSIEKAVSNTDGTAVIYDTDSEHIYSVTVNKNLNPLETKTIETKIETITLNSFVKSQNLKDIDLIKIDVETHEPEVLEGFSDYLSVFKPTILIEILTDEVAEKINSIINGLGYLYFNINENNGIRRIDKITKSDDYNLLLCSPEIAAKYFPHKV